MSRIRPVTREDVPALLALIRALARYEKKPHAVVATEPDLLRDLFGPHPKFRALIAEWEDEPVGYASFFHFYSTYRGRSVLFLEDLFVLEKFRGKGIGMALVAAVARLAIEEGCCGLRWEVLDWNRQAIEFYEKLGAKLLLERRVVAFDDQATREVAGRAE
jgi:GNAT superfamily N-acetyltransferase